MFVSGPGVLLVQEVEDQLPQVSLDDGIVVHASLLRVGGAAHLVDYPSSDCRGGGSSKVMLKAVAPEPAYD